MEKRIELERRARKANMISELNLDNCRSTSIVGLTDEYTALETLSLINVGLTTLKGFPKLPNLKKLELSDNRISNGLNYLTTSPLLQSLNLSGNKIKTLETLEPLKEFKNLTVLDLFNNEVTTTVENYRQKIFQMLPSLIFLDGYDCNDVEPRSDEEEDVNGNDSEDEVSDNMGEDDDDSDECEDDDDDDEDVEGEGEGDGDSENDNDVSLAEVYNDDIEEDNSFWDGEGTDDNEEDDDDDDDEDGEGEADGEAAGDANDSKASAADKDGDADGDADEEPQARGKKRKHEG